ncbi:hypothetical protein CVT24_010437 [Panaeolus cyanescens]|uniref:Uncharacterized protein n=1 Tax=Panaeolus cyanescens TaxID=181874 RepID=A0A409YPQ7_9AGAR|nr:hypothetical protein CVT24_010437 [Panaeolus cyanescens]
MTEYDFSPEALDAYIQKQNKIAHWARDCSRSPVSDPYTPATPHVKALNLAKGNTPYPREQGHTRRPSYDYAPRESHRTRDFDKDRERERDRARERDRGDRYYDYERRDRERDTSYDRRDERPRRHRSASHSAIPQPRPDHHQRSRVPAPLVLPNYPYYPSPSKQSSPTSWTHPPTYHVPIGPSPRDSKHSSRSSSTTLHQPSPTSYFPPYSAPPAPAPYKPTRTMTHPPQYARNQDYYYHHQPPPIPPYKPYSIDPSSAPQLPHSAGYATKPQPLLKRIFMGLTGGGSKHSQTSSSSHKTESLQASSHKITPLDLFALLYPISLCDTPTPTSSYTSSSRPQPPIPYPVLRIACFVTHTYLVLLYYTSIPYCHLTLDSVFLLHRNFYPHDSIFTTQ